MIFDTITLILGAAVLLLAVLTALLSPFRRDKLPETSKEPSEEPSEAPSADIATDETNQTPLPSGGVGGGYPLTLLVTVQNKQAHLLRRHLPQLLSQEYEAGYEVVVVAEKGDSDTEDILNSYAGNPLLYATYVPDSSRYMSRKKLAITLGVKAAHNEWIVMTDAYCSPAGNHWLQALASHIADNTTNEANQTPLPSGGAGGGCSLIIGYSNYDDEARPYYRFERLQQACYTMREARRATAYRAMGCNVVFRKSEFIEGDGYRGNLEHTRGEYDFLVNKYARRHLTAVANEPEAWVIDDAPTRHEWRSRHIYYMHTRKHLARSFRHRLLPFIDEFALHLCFLAAIGIGVFAGLTSRWILLGISIVALVLNICLRTSFARKAVRAYGEDIASWRLYPYELSGIWHKLYQHLRYWRANKTDFTTHKV
ncbi:MAG: glycosyl transferase family 2 [Prevotella sp.]|nr:glycosyl transferase family 2 [Prevotella sp.]